MNILPKKKWHVRTKENMARVRRDEAKAAEEEKARCERVKLAEHEDRLNRLKARTSNEYGPSPFDLRFCKESENANLTSASISSSLTVKATEHVNFFSELENQERQNLKEGNKDYQAEKKKEYNDWESKMGIMKRFAEDTKEYSKEKNWWENIPLLRKSITDGLVSNYAKNIISNEPESKKKSEIAPIMKQRILEHVSESVPGDATKLAKKIIKKGKSEKLKKLEKKAKKKFKKEQKKEIRKQKKKKTKKELNRRSSSSSDSSVSNKKSSKNEEKLKALRDERMRRERNEQQRIEELLNPKKEKTTTNIVPGSLDDERKRKYNTQFNPEFTTR